MYDTEIPALRDQQESSVDAWMRAAAYAAGTEPDGEYFVAPEPDNEYFVATEPDLEQINLGEAIESKKRDNLALGEALVSIGLIGRHELAEVQSAQAESDGLVDALLVASAIRSRLGEMLLKAKRITSSQLEFALELQRYEGGLLGEILLSLGWLDRQTLDATLAAQASGRKD
jgi:hypothetical protein